MDDKIKLELTREQLDALLLACSMACMALQNMAGKQAKDGLMQVLEVMATIQEISEKSR